MFRRIADAVVIEVTAQETAFLRQIPELLDSVGTGHEDAGYSVLHRTLCLGDPDVDRELQALVSPTVEAQRASDRSILERCLREGSAMTISEAHGFLRSLNEARLVLAAREGAFDDGPAWEDHIDVNSALAAVAWLGYVQSELLRALSDG